MNNTKVHLETLKDYSFQLNKTINFYLSYFERKKLFNLFPNLKDDLINQYEKLNLNEYKKNVDLKQEYKQVIYTGIENDYYQISWSITKVDNFIKKNKFEIQSLPISKLVVDYNSVNPIKLDYYAQINEDEYKPIYAIKYLPIDKLIVIDGVHRITLLKSKGFSNIRSYLFSPYSNTLFMNEHCLALYKFHHNLVCLHQFCANPLVWKFRVNKSFKWDTYNPFKENFSMENIVLKKFKIFISR